MDDFPPNSRKAKAAEPPAEAPAAKKVKPVTSAETGRRKRGLGRQFKNAFFSGSSRDAAEHAVTDVVVPAIRDTIFEALQTGLDRLIYGERASAPRRSASSMASSYQPHVSYDSITKPTRANAPTTRSLSKQARARHNIAELIIPTSREANEVIEQMFDILSATGDVSVADLYTLVNVRPDHTDVKWGWRSLKGAKAMRMGKRGYVLDLPEPEPLG